jgi:alkylated DNA repair dioxygenase AlkB
MHSSILKAKNLLKKGNLEHRVQSQHDWDRVWDNIGNVEKIKTGTAMTGDPKFDRAGYKVIRNICDPTELICDVPEERGQLNYNINNIDNLSYTKEPVETQVPGCLSRYTYPPYRKTYKTVKENIEKSIGQPLYSTYYYDRFYFPGQHLNYHTDRDACEISCTIHVSSNLKDKYPIYVKAVDGSVIAVDLKPGDGLIYKGCERPHWRFPMPGLKRDKIRKLLGKKGLYYHQIFFHYVLSNGQRSQCAGDSGKFDWEDTE